MQPKPGVKLDSLPPSSDKFWELADKGNINNEIEPECKHYFVATSGMEISWKGCHIGYTITAGDSVKDGHLYHEGQLVI